MIICLDFDGPLHLDAVDIAPSGKAELRVPGHLLFESMQLLEVLLAPHPTI